MGLLRQFPAFAIGILIAAALMLIPAAAAARLELWPAARTFLQSAFFFSFIGLILGVATMNRTPRVPARYHLLTLLLLYLLLPLMLGAPLVRLVPEIGIGGAYFEMLSCLTTTGATLFDRPQLVSEPIHLWRAIVGWMGGLIVLVTAFAILAPLNLGGFEISSGAAGGRSGTVAEATARIKRSTGIIAPIYFVMTFALMIVLILAGDPGFVALMHAMATLSTSGISPVGGLENTASGRIGEVAIALFLLPAVSHRLIRLGVPRIGALRLSDPELQLMLISVGGITLVLFLRSLIGAVEIDRQNNFAAQAQAIWGSVFTVLSFLTTTGFESRDWRAMQLWSDLPDPGLILLGVAVMGGGIATTAGGVKLLRLYALYRHGLRELDKLVHPSSVGPRGQGDQLISPQGARIAFIFLMLVLVAMGIAMIAFTATGLRFEQSLGLAVAGLSTTGGAIDAFGDGLVYRELPSAAQVVFCVAMIVGRMEALVIIALFNPTWWRA